MADPCTCPPPATHLGEGPDQDCPKHGDRLRTSCTPSTEHVRAVYTAQHGAILSDEHSREFDRWLQARDAEERARTIALLTLLADGRGEYFHGPEPEHQGDLRAMRFDELILWAERQAARQVRDIVAGDDDGRGWMPSWRWDALDALR